jgi:hypothetical protein
MKLAQIELINAVINFKDENLKINKGWNFYAWLIAANHGSMVKRSIHEYYRIFASVICHASR